jgi:hypothetical protein
MNKIDRARLCRAAEICVVLGSPVAASLCEAFAAVRRSRGGGSRNQIVMTVISGRQFIRTGMRYVPIPALT